MIRQRDRMRSTVLLLTMSLTVGYFATYTVINFSSAVSSSVHNTPTTVPQIESQAEPLSEGSFLAINGNSNCRQVVGKSFPLYATPGRITTYLQTVYGGQQIGLENGTNTTLGEDGLPYIYVSAPFGSQTPSRGYMQSQVQNASSGTTQSTLATCAISDQSSSDNTYSNNSNGPPPVGAFW